MNVSNSQLIQGRYFLVGSARSGTTLLQAMLASHPRVHSFPETHFFCEIPLSTRRYRWARLVRRDVARSIFHKVLAIVGRPDLSDQCPVKSPLFSHYVNSYRKVLDQDTVDHNKSVWVEKTPHHIDYIRQISSKIPGVRFIHVVRDGRDVIASQIDAARKNPEQWQIKSVDQAIGFWNEDIAVSGSYADDPNHLLVSYEDLILSPSEVLETVCKFVCIDFDTGMLDYHRDVSGILGWRDQHEYMSNVHRPINDTRLLKFESIFNLELQQYITQSLVCNGDAKLATGIRTRTDLAPEAANGEA